MEDKRISRRQLESALHRIGERDGKILTAIGKYKYMTTGHIRRMYFTDGTDGAALRSANRSLAGLRELGVICALARRIGGVRAGSGSFVWTLTAAGVRLLDMLRHGDGETAYRRRYEPSTAFLTHTLAVTETAVRLTELAGAKEISSPTLQTEPDNWRQYSGLGGTPKYLKPDLFVVIASGEFQDHYFLELDLSTESPSVVLKKCEQYLAYQKSGAEQAAHGIFPYVVWIVPDVKRKESIKSHIEKGLHLSASGLFLVITLEELEALILNGAEHFHKEIHNE